MMVRVNEVNDKVNGRRKEVLVNSGQVGERVSWRVGLSETA